LNEDGHILVIGAASLDMKGKPSHTPEPGTSTPGVLRSSMGGTARNVAENLARLEVDTVLLTAVGDDAVGDQILGQTAASGVNVNEAIIVAGGRSGAYMALLEDDGSLKYALDDMEIMAALTPDYFDAQYKLFSDARMVVIDANLTIASINHIVSICGQLAVPICADPTSTSLAPRLRPFISEFYLISPNVAETRALVDYEFDPSDRDGAERAARYLVSEGVGRAIVTLSEFGVVYATSETSGHVPAIQTHIVDQTGAGDAQTAGVIFGLIEGMPTDEAVRLGVTAASLTLRTRDSVRPDLSVDLLYDELVI